MRKATIILAAMLIALPVFTLEKEENSMVSFMGQKWGVSAAEFLKTFKYKNQLIKISPASLGLQNFKLWDMVVPNIIFSFKGEVGKKLRFVKKNYDKFFFDSVGMQLKPDQFDSILEIFKIKYGKPTWYTESDIQTQNPYRTVPEYRQKVARWMREGIGREIVLIGYANNMFHGFVVFLPKFDGNSEGTNEGKKKSDDKQ